MKLEPMRVDEEDSGHAFAVEFSKQIKKYFDFVLNEKNKKVFQPIYHATSYLAPFSRMVLPKEKTAAIKKFLKGVYYINKCFLYKIVCLRSDVILFRAFA